MHRRSRAAVALVMLSVAPACAPATAPDRSHVARGIRTGTGIDAGDLPEPGRGWTTPPGVTLDDGLAVDEAVAIALWNNADFQLALATLGLARADLIEAGLLKNPIFSLLFPWGPKQLEFTATFAVDQLWQRPKRIDDARLNAEATADELIASGLRLVADVRLAVFEVLVADGRLTLATEEASAAAQSATLADGQFRAGDISEFDARLARTDAVRLETTRLMRVTTRDLAMARLRTLLGLDADAPAIRLSEPAAPRADGCRPGPELVRSALAARPDVRAAELHLEAAGRRAGLEEARIVTLTALLDANARGPAGFEMGPGAAIELPLLSQNQGRRARAAAEIEQASRRYLAVRAAVSAEVAAAIIGLTEAESAARVLNAEVTASLAAARQQSDGLYKAGEISLLTLLETRRRLIELEGTRLDAMFGVNRAIVRLEQAVGRTCGAT